MVLGIYWWNPLAWLARAQVQQAEEECCDGWVVWLFPDKARLYAETLVDTVDFLAGFRERIPGMATAFGRKNALTRRIRMVVSDKLTRRLSWNTRAVLLLVALVITPVSLAGPEAKPNEHHEKNVAKARTDATGERAAAGRRSEERAAKGIDPAHEQFTRHWKLTTVLRRQRGQEHLKQHARVAEKWIDLKTGESYRKNTTRVDGIEVLTNEAVFDGRRAMLVYHEENEVAFIDVSPLHGRMQRRLYKGKQLRRAYVGDPRRSKRFSKTGEAELLGTQCEIWSGEVPTSPASETCKVRAWLDPDTDELIRLETRNEHTGRRQSYELLERNRPIPAQLLKMEPPPEFTQVRTKATAPTQRVAWAGFGAGGMKVFLNFLLPDGSVLLCSSLEGPNTRDYMKSLVENLEAGDPLPTSSRIIGSLRTIGLDEEIEFVGHHLRVTEDEERCYQWTIHVPQRQLTDTTQYYGYAITVIPGRNYRDGKRVFLDSSTHDMWKGFPIRHADDFRSFVIASMREYSGTESETIYPTFEEVLQLVATIRESAVGHGPRPSR